MDQLSDFADSRLIISCVYCGGLIETRDHVPSRIFLDEPFPTNLPVLPACYSCNNSFSIDEEYVACAIESAIAGSTDPDLIRRQKVASILRRSPALRARIEQSKIMQGDQVLFNIESDRFKNIILKLARGHTAYELSTPCREEPKSVVWTPLCLMSVEQKDSFEACHVTNYLNELGSRGQQRTMVTQIEYLSPSGKISKEVVLIIDWIDVQEGRYSYLVYQEGEVVVAKIIIAEYLACEVIWEY